MKCLRLTGLCLILLAVTVQGARQSSGHKLRVLERDAASAATQASREANQAEEMEEKLDRIVQDQPSSGDDGSSDPSDASVKKALRATDEAEEDQKIAKAASSMAEKEDWQSFQDQTRSVQDALKGKQRLALEDMKRAQVDEKRSIADEKRAQREESRELRDSQRVEDDLSPSAPQGSQDPDVSTTRARHVAYEAGQGGICIGQCFRKCKKKCRNDAQCLQSCSHQCGKVCRQHEMGRVAADQISEEEAMEKSHPQVLEEAGPPPAASKYKMDKTCLNDCLPVCDSKCQKKGTSASRCAKKCKAQCEDDCYIDEGGGLPAPDEQMDGSGEQGLGNIPNALMKRCMDECKGRCEVPCVNSFPFRGPELEGESEKQIRLRHYFNCSTQSVIPLDLNPCLDRSCVALSTSVSANLCRLAPEHGKPQATQLFLFLSIGLGPSPLCHAKLLSPIEPLARCRNDCLPICEPAVKQRIEDLRQQRDNENHPFFGADPEDPMPAGAERAGNFEPDDSKSRHYAKGYAPKGVRGRVRGRGAGAGRAATQPPSGFRSWRRGGQGPGFEGASAEEFGGERQAYKGFPLPENQVITVQQSAWLSNIWYLGLVATILVVGYLLGKLRGRGARSLSVPLDRMK